MENSNYCYSVQWSRYSADTLSLPWGIFAYLDLACKRRHPHHGKSDLFWWGHLETGLNTLAVAFQGPGIDSLTNCCVYGTKMTTTKLATKAQFRRRTSAEPNQIQRIKFMWSAASESIRNGWFNLGRLSQLIPPDSAGKNDWRPVSQRIWTSPDPNPLADMDPPFADLDPLPNFLFKHPLYHIW